MSVPLLLFPTILLFSVNFMVVSLTLLCDSLPSYKPDSISRFIPYANAATNRDLFYDVLFDFSISTAFSDKYFNFSAPMDTGSTGVVIGASQLDLTAHDLENYPKGHEFLSSSHVFWEGHWINASEVNFTFTAADVIAKVPILAVTESSICGNFSKGKCDPKSKTHVNRRPNRINYLGVGFGRHSDQQPAATRDKVPLTNIAFIDGLQVPQNAMHPGYIINSSGVEIGLTSENTLDFRKTKLQPLDGGTPNIDWRAPDVVLAVDDTNWNHGTALFDTGIHQSYIRLDHESTTQLHKKTVIENGKRHTILADDSTVHIRIGDPSDYIAQYDVTVNDTTNAVRPSCGEFRPEIPSSPPAFINTGRYFYRGYDTMLDAEYGWFGLRRKIEPIKGRNERCNRPLSVQEPHKIWRQRS